MPRSGVERDQMIAGSSKHPRRRVAIAGPVRHAAPADCGRRGVTPDDFRGLRFERDDVLARRHVHDAVDHERRHLQAVDAGVERPRRLQRCDVGRRDLLQRREALAAGIVVVRRPVVDAGGDEAAMRTPRRARRPRASSSSVRELQRELHDSRVAAPSGSCPKLALFSAVTGGL